MGLISVDDKFEALLNDLEKYDIGIEACIFRDGIWKPVKVTKNLEGTRVIVYKDGE